ncbi:hypothetical protein JKP75_11410 [Blastococcus sp. TML/M2B]|uniref:hypothetical protein n=1 Tax=unclassified Blastococcus TaxID=2619396 RepID=UPI00190CD8AA|nr:MULTISPECIES: hypothetical protein [unclassified Blastococcus]MBN1093106.1 hypothetical protein [Blastococcus sp. TML/M2B]MBN1096772.1 hypothetical protein [Blastococcus sp. TML/C7B]
MSVLERRTTAPVLPAPRAASPDDAVPQGDAFTSGPGRPFRARPRHHYWDVATASWRTRDGQISA